MADLYYIEEGYWDPSLGYYVYTADAAAAVSSTATISATADKLVSATASASSSFTQSSQIERLRDATATASAEFAQSASAGKILDAVINCGALFAPSIIADALKNHTAILDVVFTVNTVGAANRAASIAVDNIANLNAQAAKTVDVVSAFNLSATTSTTVSKFSDTSSTLQTQSTLAVDALSVQLAAASLTSTASITAQAKQGIERPLTVHSSGSVQINTTTKKFGAGSLEITNNGFLKYYADEFTIPQNYQVNGTREELVIEFWYRPGTVDGDTLLQYTDGTTVYWQVFDNASFQYVNTSNATINKTASVAPTAGQFNHVLIAMTANSNFSIYINGTRRHNSTASTEFKDNADGTGFLQIGQSTLGANGYLDELRVITGPSGTVSALGYDITQSTITQPTGQFANTTTTRFLGHYDVDFRDDTATLVTPSPALTSQFSFTAQAASTQSAAANLASTATTTTTTGVIRSAESALSTQATQSTTATRIKEAISALSCEFTIDVKGHVKRNIIDWHVDGVFTTTIEGARTRFGEITITSAFTPTLTANAFKNHTAVLDAVSTLIAQATTSVDSASALSSAAALSSAPSRTRTADSTISAVVSIAATVYRTQDNQASIAAASELTAIAGQEVEALGAFTAQFTQSSTVAKTAEGMSQASSAFTQSTLAERTRSTAVSLAAAITQSATAVKINPGHAALAATASLSAQAVKTTEITATVDSAFTQSTAVNKTVRPGLTFNSIATQLTVAFQNASGTVLLESSATLSAIIGSIKQGVPERAITGIRFNDDAATELGDTFIRLAHYNAPPAGPNLSNNWAVAFWAYSPQGVVLTHNPTTYQAASGYMKFDNGSFELRSPSPNNDYRSATWTGLTTVGWHHYIVYQEYNASLDPVVKLYQDGVLKSSPSIFSYDDGSSPAPPTDDLLAVWYDPRFLFTDLNWTIGALVQHLERTPGSASGALAAYQITPMQGVLSQFVSYWSTVPAFTDTAVREKLYNAGPVDLGNMGTSSGLARPNIYLRLQSYRDVAQLGSLSFDLTNPNGSPPSPRLEWVEITNLDYVPPSQSSVHYVLTGPHEGTVQDNFGNGFLAITDLTCNVTGVFLFELPISAVFSSSQQGDRIRTANTQLVNSFALTASASAQLSLASDITSVATAAISGDRIRTSATAITATASITIEQGFLQVAFADLAAMSQLTCDATEIEAIQGAAVLTSTATVTADVNNVLFMQATASAAFAITAEATLIPPVRASADLVSAFTLTVDGGGVRGAISLVASLGTVTANVNVIRGARATILSAVSQETITNKRTGIPLTNLQVNAFSLTAGDVINFELSLTYVIPEETRELLILAESREYAIEQETRQLTLLEG